MADNSPPPKKRARTSSSTAFEDIFRQRDVGNNILSNLGIRDAMSLRETSTAMNAVVDTQTVVPHLEGMRKVGGQEFWSTDPSSEPKRYFKPMDVFGNTQAVPHVSEQSGHPNHVTDVATMAWPQSGPLPSGNHPSKLQYQQSGAPLNASGDYPLGAINAPVKPQNGRVLMQPHANAGLASDVFIESKSYNKSKQGPLPASYPTTQLSVEQRTKTVGESQTQFENATVKRFEKR